MRRSGATLFLVLLLGALPPGGATSGSGPVEGEWTAFVTPEGGTPVLLDFIAEARERLDVAVYTLEAPHLARALGEAAERGVAVRLLVEGAPVGGLSDAGRAALAHLVSRGVDARAMTSSVGAPARYPYMHAKYAVRDGEALLLASENWNSGAFPTAPREGASRGWGLVVVNRSLAHTFAATFEADFGGRDARAVDLSWAPPLAIPLPVAGSGWAAAARADARWNATPVFAPLDPHGLEGVSGFLRGATRTLDVQQLFVDARWSREENPFVVETLGAAERGASVRILLDGRFGRAENEAVARALEDAAEEGAVLARVGSADWTLHNKGAIADRARILVGSLNWGEGSVMRNREAALIVESPVLATFFTRAFEADWARPLREEHRTPWPGLLWLFGLGAVAVRAAGEPSDGTANPSKRSGGIESIGKLLERARRTREVLGTRPHRDTFASSPNGAAGKEPRTRTNVDSRARRASASRTVESSRWPSRSR